jgi:two-component system, chemotaxis family, sensor kinase CheA
MNSSIRKQAILGVLFVLFISLEFGVYTLWNIRGYKNLQSTMENRYRPFLDIWAKLDSLALTGQSDQLLKQGLRKSFDPILSDAWMRDEFGKIFIEKIDSIDRQYTNSQSLTASVQKDSLLHNLGADIESLRSGIHSYVFTDFEDLFKKSGKYYRIAGLVMLFMSLLFIGYFFFVLKMLKSLRLLEEEAQEIAAGDIERIINVDRVDEVGSLQNTFEEMRMQIRGVVDGLDDKVEEAKSEIQEILDKLEDGYLVFDEKGIVQTNYSARASEFFGQGLEGRHIKDVLRQNGDSGKNLVLWLETLFKELLPFDDAVELGINHTAYGENRYLEIRYRPIYKDEKLHKVIMIASDKTHERLLEEQARRTKEMVERFIKISKDREGFVDFVRESRKALWHVHGLLSRKELDLDPEINYIFRCFHTIKGNSGMYRLNEIQSSAHEIESALSQYRDGSKKGFKNLVPVIKSMILVMDHLFNNTLRENNEILSDLLEQNDNIRKIQINNKNLEDLETALLNQLGRDSEVYQRFVNYIIYEPLVPQIMRYEEMSRELANSQGKQLAPFILEGEDIRVRVKQFRDLLASLVHAFRNAVDHGIEDVATRIALGKNETGVITLRVEKKFENKMPRLRIAIRDDGCGIDASKLRAKLLQKGVLSEQALEELSDDDVVQWVFKPGISTLDEVTDVSGRGVGMDAIISAAHTLNGTAWVETQKGKGTTVVVECSFDVHFEEKPKILVIDDNSMTIKLIQKMFLQDGLLSQFTLHAVTKSEDGLKLLFEENIALLITDWIMPGITGTDVVKFVRLHEKYSHIPIVMLSSVDSTEEIEEAKRCGVNHYLHKPVVKEHLIQLIKELFPFIGEKQNDHHEVV